MVTASSRVVDDSIGSFPRGPELSLDWVLCCCGNFAKDEISYIELSKLHPLIVVFGHLSLVLRHSARSFVSYFV